MSGAGLSPELQGELLRAFHARDAARLRELFAEHPEAGQMIDAPLFPFDSPALAHFSGGDDVELIDLLLELGADPNRRSDWWAGGFHPLHRASPANAERLMRAGAVVDACAAAHLDRLDLLREILDADPDRVHERGGDGQTPLHFARSREAADLLLERGADIDAEDVDHRATPAQWMLARERGAGRYHLARHLVDRGAATDVFLASALGLTERLRSMLGEDRGLLDVRTGRGDYGPKPPSSYHIYLWTIGANLSPARVAEQFGHVDAARLVRELAGPEQLFLEACESGRADTARRLLHDHPEVLSELEPTDHRVVADAAWAGDAATVEMLLELGLDPAVRGHDGGNALHCAAWQGAVECVRAILAHEDAGRLIEDRDTSYDATPFGWCIHGARYSGSAKADHATVARLLLEAGAEVPEDAGELPASVREVVRRFRDS